ncbi:type VI secretion system membrane subunit TssM [Massilia sp. NEAU-DD11]|uniref:Type VI secretion system membrane subunit TssM n=1 Tax=Massilia cellulosiltytica TaxID=2683234 RepID=A0A7X3FWS5_9BURK|nr:type VI secretion system membrane subunit TssM [Telluria cellulosilytica]MVW58482.1 type VI secretion system membrane subunit TssM [Telluria cellulosilytica]
MKKFFTWLIKPAVLAFLGALLLALVIWFELPLVSYDGHYPFASETVRWTFIFIVFALWAGWLGWRWFKAWRANRELMKSVAGEDAKPAPAPEEGTAEVAQLNKRMQDAIAILKKSRTGAKGGLYQLPWYMFIGAPGSGKTTALTQSGLKFPLADALGKGAIGGVGGTRNCDWWFTDDAVLLDTAGRYTTQDSNAGADKAAWTGFLQLLKKYRRRRPINGVIVTVPVSDLLQDTEAGRQAQAQAIRDRLKELHDQLGVRFPVYVLVTKCDLLGGFVEFFDALGREERAQVWGMTFPLQDGIDGDAALAAFPAEFEQLEQRLQERVLARMQQERDPHKRALVYSFPQQFAGIEDVLKRFLDDVFASNRYERQALLRGVYFSSGTQEGSPLDRVMSAMAASFGLERQALAPNAASGRSYFITHLLLQVIFPEAELAGVNHALEKRRRMIQWGAVGAIAVAFVLLGAGMITSYVRNRAYVADMEAKSADIAKQVAALPAQGSTVQLLPVLDALRTLPGGYDDRDKGAPFLNRFGLYQGDKLGEAARIAYRKVLQDTLLPRLQQRMEDQLRRSAANSPEYLYEVLRVYLMLGDASHFDAESVAAWAALDDARNLKDANDDQKAALAAHELALMENFRDGQAMPRLDPQLISDTRLTLARMPLEQRVYNRLKRQLVREKLPEFSPASAGGREAANVFVRKSGEPITRGVNGMFSPAGYAKFLEMSNEAVDDVEKERWVLAQQEATQAGNRDQVRQAVLRLYYDDYIAQWDALLADVSLRPFGTLEQGARITNLLSGTESPMRKFLVAASKETTLGATRAPLAASVTAAVKGKLDAYKKKLESAMASTDDAAPAAPVKAANPVDAHFEDLHKMTTGTPSPLDQSLGMLKDVAVYLDSAAAAKRTGAPPPPGDALAKVKLEADGKPAPLGTMLKSIDNGGAGLTSGSERERLNALWTAGPAQFCRQAVAGRYPIVKSAAQDVTADDFGRMFAPGGLIDDFFAKNLAQYVDMGGAQWRWRATANDGTLGIPQSTLDEFQRAAKIRDAFFANGGRQASMRFDLKPVALDPAITKFVLDIDGQALTAAPGALAPASFQLPSGKGGGQVRLDVTPASAHGSLHTEGPWAWFRMLDKATVAPTAQGERYNVTFDADGRKATLELTASSVVNPFRRATLEQFRCVDKL